jgi:diacylglycerol kinase (ATP)
MLRILNAFRNSRDGLAYVVRNETAFRQEAVLFVLSIPVAFFLADSAITYLALTGCLLLLMIVELLNTGIEAVCDGLSRDYMDEIKIAKDCGSAAVLLASLQAGAIWLLVLLDRVDIIW